MPERCKNIIKLNLITCYFIEIIYKNFSEFFHSSKALDRVVEYVVVGIGVGLHFVCPTHLCHLTHLMKSPLEPGCPPLSPVFVAGLGTSFLLLLQNPAFMMELMVFYLSRSCVEAPPCALFFRCMYISQLCSRMAFLCLWIALGLLHWWELHKRDQCYRHVRFRKQCSLIAQCL